MEHLEIREDLHRTIKLYCFFKKIPMKEFVDRKLRELPELKEVATQSKRINLRT